MRVLKELARLRRDDIEAARSQNWLEMLDSKRRKLSRQAAA
jgi:hypothetical protein